MIVAGTIDEACSLLKTARPRLVVVHWARDSGSYEQLDRLLWTTTVQARRIPVLVIAERYRTDQATMMYRMGVSEYISRSHHLDQLGPVFSPYLPFAPVAAEARGVIGSAQQDMVVEPPGWDHYDPGSLKVAFRLILECWVRTSWAAARASRWLRSRTSRIARCARSLEYTDLATSRLPLRSQAVGTRSALLHLQHRRKERCSASTVLADQITGRRRPVRRRASTTRGGQPACAAVFDPSWPHCKRRRP